jgi:uncharacterized protein (TIGR00725 family)
MYQICVSGAARGESVEEGRKLARELGQAIAAAGHSLLTGATIGLPNYAAEAYKAAGGKMSVGISPAGSKVEHIMKYRLPVKAYDTILYTGLHYVGRDTLLITSSDAVISVGGRIGTLHEFTIAFETNTPIGFLEGAGGVSDEIKDLMKFAKPVRPGTFVTFNEDPARLIEELTGFLDKEYAKYQNLYQ